jgi:hypothetical protein
MIRVMGKVDASRLSTAQEGLSELMNDLRDFPTAIASNPSSIEQASRNINGSIKNIMRDISA